MTAPRTSARLRIRWGQDVADGRVRGAVDGSGKPAGTIGVEPDGEAIGREMQPKNVAEASGSRTHPRHRVPHDGFEARAQHRPRLASRPIVARQCGLRGGAEKATLETILRH